MDYEKLHKDTITNLQEMVNSGKITVETARRICADFIPESEDERIRKAIIDVLKAVYECADIPFISQKQTLDSYVAYLEKQGEQKFVPKFEVGDVMRTLQEAADGMTDGVPVIVSIDDEYYHCTNELIAIKDQDDYEYPPMNKKQHSWSEEDEAVLDALTRRLEGEDIYVSPHLAVKFLKSIKDRVQPQPRQEWSEKDEKHINSLLERLKGLCKNEFTRTTFAVSEDEDWLKSLRNRVLPQAKQEWSIKDEQAFIESVEALEDFGKFELADWLKEHKNKFLRSQSYWKPSKEQMEAVRIAAEIGTANNSWAMGILKGMYQDIKKL